MKKLKLLLFFSPTIAISLFFFIGAFYSVATIDINVHYISIWDEIFDGFIIVCSVFIINLFMFFLSQWLKGWKSHNQKKSILDLFFNALFFRGSYQYLPTAIFFWYQVISFIFCFNFPFNFFVMPFLPLGLSFLSACSLYGGILTGWLPLGIYFALAGIFGRLVLVGIIFVINWAIYRRFWLHKPHPNNH